MAYIIGKLPGYNKRIDADKGKYAEKLLHNITKAKFTPIGWSIDFKNMFDSHTEAALYNIGSGSLGGSSLSASTLINGAATEIKEEVIPEPKTEGLVGEALDAVMDKYHAAVKAANEAYKAAIKKAEDYFKRTDFENSKFKTQAALDLWQSICAANGITAANTGFTVLGTNDSTFTEVLSNNYKDNSISSIARSVTPERLAGIAKGLTSLSSMAGSSWARVPLHAADGSEMLGLLLGDALGVQTSIPKEWQTSAYNSNLQLMIKLMSPSGYPDDVIEYVLEPLITLLAAVSPITYKGVLFGHPPLWRIEAEGLQTINVGAITTMSITRGGNETQFNYLNQPLNIDVRLSVESIIPGFATSAAGAALYTGNKGMGQRKIMATNPQDIRDAFGDNKTGSGLMQKLTIKL